MKPFAEAVGALAGEVARAAAVLGRTVDLEAAVLDRSGFVDLAEPTEWSANGRCRLVPTRDGWIAVNLPRDDDLDLLPAWIGCGFGDPPWPAILEAAAGRPADDLVRDAQRLGLPVARVGSVKAAEMAAPAIRMAAGTAAHREAWRVIDLSSLWAGPLCGALLASAGADVVKAESVGRPDAARDTPRFFEALNGAKRGWALDFSDPEDLARLRAEIVAADVLITGARPRAFGPLGLAPQPLFSDNPGLVWVAVTGYAWAGPRSNWVAFGDDASAAGGLVRWAADGPRFLGDALADPVTGLAAAAGALRALADGGGVVVDVALSRTAAGAAAFLGLEAAA